LENINFKSKNLFLTSHYLFTNDTSFITKTIIDGSSPNHPDTASCILIIKHQDSTSVVQGFTITGGKGTKWPDEHSSGIYREGGGILVALSSPIIRHNLIKGNEAINFSGLYGTGGGGIRCGDGKPKILNNVFINNHGLYGGAIVLNYCAAAIRNNIIANNVGGEEYGGGGIWINGNISTFVPDTLENNTIVNNYSYTDGGGILLWDNLTRAIIKNNIIFGNTAATFSQISFRGALNQVTYCDVEDDVTGTGNINVNPGFAATQFYLGNTSPCIDSGDINPAYNDPADPENLTKALFPSKGALKNDMGAYGGPGASLLPTFKNQVFTSITNLVVSNSILNYPNPFTNTTNIIYSGTDNNATLIVYSVDGKIIKTYTGLNSGSSIQFDGNNLAGGVYLYKLITSDKATVTNEMLLIR
jgi:hypothetical protein